MSRFLLITLFLCTLSACSNMLFFPVKEHFLDPAEHGVKYQDIYIETENNQNLHGWLLPVDGEAKATVVFFHGNGENISTHIGAVYWLPKIGYRVLLVDYRGYGKSDGQATLDGSITDITQTIKFTSESYRDDKPLIVMGQSIGASMSIYAVANSTVKDKIAGLVLVAPFSDYQQITQEALSKSWLTWLFQYPLSWTINNDYKPADFIKSVYPIPVYFIHGTSDRIISNEHSKKLFDLARQPKKLYLIDGGHNDIANTEKYRSTVTGILEEIVSNQKSISE